MRARWKRASPPEMRTARAVPSRCAELTDARKAFEEVRPHGWRDAEATYVKDPDLVHEVTTGRGNCAIRALRPTRTGRARRVFRSAWRGP
jgi:hypothetical protein